MIITPYKYEVSANSYSLQNPNRVPQSTKDNQKIIEQFNSAVVSYQLFMHSYSNALESRVKAIISEQYKTSEPRAEINKIEEILRVYFPEKIPQLDENKKELFNDVQDYIMGFNLEKLALAQDAKKIDVSIPEGEEMVSNEGRGIITNVDPSIKEIIYNGELSKHFNHETSLSQINEKVNAEKLVKNLTRINMLEKAIDEVKKYPEFTVPKDNNYINRMITKKINSTEKDIKLLVDKYEQEETKFDQEMNKCVAQRIAKIQQLKREQEVRQDALAQFTKRIINHRIIIKEFKDMFDKADVSIQNWLQFQKAKYLIPGKFKILSIDANLPLIKLMEAMIKVERKLDKTEYKLAKAAKVIGIETYKGNDILDTRE